MPLADSGLPLCPPTHMPFPESKPTIKFLFLKTLIKTGKPTSAQFSQTTFIYRLVSSSERMASMFHRNPTLFSLRIPTVTVRPIKKPYSYMALEVKIVTTPYTILSGDQEEDCICKRACSIILRWRPFMDLVAVRTMQSTVLIHEPIA